MYILLGIINVVMDATDLPSIFNIPISPPQ